MREPSGVLRAYDATRTLRADPDEQQARPHTPDCLLEHAIVRCGPSHRIGIATSTTSTITQRCCRHPCMSSRSSNATILLPTLTLVKARLKLSAPRSERRHRARVAVAREEEKRGARGECSVQCRQLRVEACDGLK